MQPINNVPHLDLKKFAGQKKYTRNEWTEAEKKTLRQLVGQYGTDWKKISEIIQTRTRDQCKQHWSYTNPSIDKSPLTEQEKDKLAYLVTKYGKKWQTISKVYFPHRSSRCLSIYWDSLMKQQSKIDKESISREEQFSLPPTGYKHFVPIILFNEPPKPKLLQSFHSAFSKIT